VDLRRSLDPREADPEFVAFCFDQAVWFLESYVQGELDAVPLGKGNNAEKRQKVQQERLLNRLLGISSADTPGQFRDPGAFM